MVELESSDQHHVLGLLADAVSEVVELDVTSIEDAPSFGSNIRAEFIQGLRKLTINLSFYWMQTRPYQSVSYRI